MAGVSYLMDWLELLLLRYAKVKVICLFGTSHCISRVVESFCATMLMDNVIC
jgi:hypothetical protein